MGLDPWTPLCREVQARQTKEFWFKHEREHLTGWLGDYGGPGAYGRKNPGKDARFFYNHFNDAWGLVWLAEALGVDEAAVAEGIEAIEAVADRGSARSGAFRKVVPWSAIEPLVRERLGR